ncbi:MAG: GNAT family N-acetyltransferase [Phycisphaerales bacterium]
MDETVKIRSITAAQTRPIRQRVLRPHQAASELVYPGDDAHDSFHLGAYRDNELLAILSMYFMPKQGETSHAWRIRGMASIPEARGIGLGRMLVEMARDQAWGIKLAPIWCNARQSAFGFYEKLGFVIEGEVFEIEGIGPHAVMVLNPR